MNAKVIVQLIDQPLPRKNSDPKQLFQLKDVAVYGQRVRCLLANDDEMQLQSLAIILSKFDIKVIPAKNGYEALMEAEKSIKEDLLFDLVLLDLNMPITDGYEACI